ncbi:MAG: toprim domain-containing protein [Dehalococcoidia bacterium]
MIVEGETDAWTLWRNDIPALGLPGAATWKESWRPHLDGIETVYLWREADQGGDTLTAAIRLDVPNVQIISAPVGLKDPSALWHACGHDADEFRSRFSALLDAARPASQLREEQLSTEAREVYRRAAPLLESPDLLDKVEAAIREGGYAGDTRPPMLAYLAITSRHLDRPLNLHFLSPSGGGKNRSVDGGSELHPPEAFHLEKAGSARALIYTAEDLRNRVVIVAEADSLPQEDGSAASAIRSLAEDGFMTYDVVEKDPQSGEFRTRRIRKDGPTGLITTGTKPLGEQLSTRCLTVTVSDTPAQTLAVTRAHAAAVNGERPGRDVSVFIDAQRWIELAGDHEVTVPFGHHLAELVPHDHVRMRRDFRQLLTAIQAVGLLFQRQRERDARGRIVATLEDYAHARRYLLDAFTTAATDGVTPQVRETVEAVIAIQKTELQASSIKALAGALGLTPQATRKRAWSAVALGYLHNTADRGQPLSLIPGDPLPTARPALPAVADLSTHVCGVVPETEFPGFPAAESDSEPGSSRETEDICPPIPAFAEVTPETEKARGKRPAFPIMTAARVDSESERTHQEAAGNRETGNRGDQHTCMDCGGPVDPDVQRCNLCVADILDRLDQ